MYTDASKNSNGVGFAIIIGHDNHTFSLPPSTNIYTAETYAIFEALKIASSSNLDSFAIISDSLSALRLIVNPYSKNELVQHIQELISTTNKTFSFMRSLLTSAFLVTEEQINLQMKLHFLTIP